MKILAEKSSAGVEVKLIYDDIGCMMTLPSDYYKQLRKFGIDCITFARLKGQANNEFNSRSHRKITVIDGKTAYTGGVNVADEYINRKKRFGLWKDTGIRIEGEAVREMVMIFLQDYSINVKNMPEYGRYSNYCSTYGKGFIIPFGSGPAPAYSYQTGKTVIINMLFQAKEYVYITSPYVIIDSEIFRAIENAAQRGVEIRIIIPHIPDKKLTFLLTKNFCRRLSESGVKVYEYTLGFIHAKTYISDDIFAVTGTINLDYRSLIHHFENGIWLYKSPAIADIKKDFLDTCSVSSKLSRNSLFQKAICSLIKIFAPLF